MSLKAENFYIEVDNMSKSKAELKEVATILVRDGNKILMGKRSDNGKWTTPGGHLEPGEDKIEGALRELKEEAGISADKKELKHLTSENVTTFTGKKMKIHAFVVDMDKPKTSSKNDPDEEVKKWEWINTAGGLPKDVASNLHSPKNVALRQVGLQKGMIFTLDQIFGDIWKPVFEHVEKLQDEKKGNTDGLTKSVGQARAGHKYLRRYRRGDRWMYVYHEGEGPGRQLHPEAHEALKRLAEAGHADSRALIESTQDHNEHHLQALRALADTGHEESKQHLKNLGINREQEKLEEAVVPAAVRQVDPVDKDESASGKAGRLRQKALESLKAELDHMQRYATSPLPRAVLAAITPAKFAEAMDGKNSIRQILNTVHEQMQKIDRAQGTMRSERGEINDAGGVGNKIYNDFIKRAEADELLPAGFKDIHQRKKGEEFNVPEIKRMQEIAEKKKREKEEAERRSLAEVHGSMAHHMNSLMERPLPVSEVKAVHKAFKEIFGKNLRKEDWPYDFSEHGYKVKIAEVSHSSNRVTMSFKVTDREGNVVTRQWSRSFSKRGSVVDIHNDYLSVDHGARGGDKPLGSLINKSQIEFLKKVAPRNGQISVYAALDVGGYNWANQGFAFESDHDVRNYQSSFKRYLQGHGINLTDAELRHFTLPCHFAAFDTGKVITRSSGTIQLSQKQKETGTLNGKPGGPALTAAERSSGKTTRIACHLGKDFMLGKSWNGIFKASDAKDTNEAYKYFMNYDRLRNSAWKTFSAPTKAVYEARQQGPGAARPTVSAPSTGPPASARRRVVRPRNFANQDARQQEAWLTENMPHMSRAAVIAARRIIAESRSRRSGG
jgi:8-oxo-dGTP pyrophosphatase MutT (NUDIX family)